MAGVAFRNVAMPAKIAFVWSFWRTIWRTTWRRGRFPVSRAMHHLS